MPVLAHAAQEDLAGSSSVVSESAADVAAALGLEQQAAQEMQAAAEDGSSAEESPAAGRAGASAD